ncbi:MAG: DMT family transporter [Rectinemataceae bacterium]|nr:DMT family transporter [Rectinemataceae bacterium]
MKAKDALLLVLLAAIWGSSFIFMRYLSPILGPVLTATIRTLASGVVLCVFFAMTRVRLDWRKNFRHYAIVGLANSAIPFLLFSWAALKIPAAVSSIANSMSPLWGAIFAALILGEIFTVRKLAGLGLGIAGVAVISLFGKDSPVGVVDLIPILACVLATVLYGFSGTYIKRWASDVPSRSMTAASLLVAGLALLPLAATQAPTATVIPVSVWIVAFVFSILCSAIAYLIYFRLIASAGVTRALSVTLLIPVFAFLWGYLFLGETVRPAAFAGAALVLSGTALITGKGKAGSSPAVK